MTTLHYVALYYKTLWLFILNIILSQPTESPVKAAFPVIMFCCKRMYGTPTSFHVLHTAGASPRKNKMFRKLVQMV